MTSLLQRPVMRPGSRSRSRPVLRAVCALAALASLSVVAVSTAGEPVARSRAQDVVGDRGDALVVHVLNRVAFGPRPGDVERVRRIGVEAYLDEQLHPERIVEGESLQRRLAALDVVRLPAGTLIDAYRSEQRAVQAARREQARLVDAGAKADGKGAAAAGEPMAMASVAGSAAVDDVVAARRDQYRRLALQTAEARLVQAIEGPRQLQEVLTDFWYSHFNVFVGKDLDRVLVANYERDAIRPNVLGHFRDLLGATARHPAMLYYLDNWLSTGADADVNVKAKQRAGLNENYARELMELHTLGVESESRTDGQPGNAGRGAGHGASLYTQKDVTELARMLTGWTFDARASGRGGPLAGVESDALFVFAPRRHDNGAKTWLGHTVPANGRQEGEFALDVLAMHPATARHVSFRLAQYFVADQPPAALVERMAARWMATDGDLREVMRTLLGSAEFRAPTAAGAKFKTPYQYVVSAARAGGVPVMNVQPLVAALVQVGMPLYGCQTPDGYRNTEAAWLNPEGMTRRIAFATALAAGRLPVDRPAPLSASSATLQPASRTAVAMPVSGAAAADAAPSVSLPSRSAPLQAVALLETLGPAIGARTRDVVLGSDPQLAAALVLGSPDFMRR